MFLPPPSSFKCIQPSLPLSSQTSSRRFPSPLPEECSTPPLTFATPVPIETKNFLFCCECSAELRLPLVCPWTTDKRRARRASKDSAFIFEINCGRPQRLLNKLGAENNYVGSWKKNKIASKIFKLVLRKKRSLGTWGGPRAGNSPSGSPACAVPTRHVLPPCGPLRNQSPHVSADQ